MSATDPVERVSVSIPGTMLERFDTVIEERGFDSRSQGLCELIAHEIDRHESAHGNDIMAGTITLIYEHARGDIKKKLADLQYEHIREVISCHQVLLENFHTLEVILVQGRARKLNRIANKFITTKGVKSGHMSLTATVMPPLQHPEEED